MAYFDQEMKKQMAPKIKNLLNKFGLKGSLSVYHHSSVSLKVVEGKHNLLENVVVDGKGYFHVNEYHLEFYENNPILHSFLKEALAILNGGNWDKSDIQTDYFNVGWYVCINIGSYDKPYIHKEN